MRSEIGSEFWTIPVSGQNDLFPADTQWFRSGRSALTAILREGRFRKAALPQWCCDSMILPFLQEGVQVEFYPVLEQTQLPEADVTLVMDYFGWKQCPVEPKGTVIRDLTHSLLRPADQSGDYCFGSLRKWAGFWTGGYAWGLKEPVRYEENDGLCERLRRQAMEEKERYISGLTDSKGYLSVFAQAEDALEVHGVFPAAQRDILLARSLDVDLIRRRRRENARVLLEGLGELALFRGLGEEDCPLFVPVLLDDRDRVRRHLIGHQVYCPVHWPKTDYHRLDTNAQKLYDHELSLVCDQRYSPEDMERVVALIRDIL